HGTFGCSSLSVPDTRQTHARRCFCIRRFTQPSSFIPLKARTALGNAMPVGLPLAFIILLAQAAPSAPAATPGYGPAPAAPAKVSAPAQPTPECVNQYSDPKVNQIVVFAIKPES